MIENCDGLPCLVKKRDRSSKVCNTRTLCCQKCEELNWFFPWGFYIALGIGRLGTTKEIHRVNAPCQFVLLGVWFRRFGVRP